MEAKKKKPYSPPSITNFGSVIVQTKGLSGDAYEFMNQKPSIFDIEP